jgi:hypothetical protein
MIKILIIKTLIIYNFKKHTLRKAVCRFDGSLFLQQYTGIWNNKNF